MSVCWTGLGHPFESENVSFAGQVEAICRM